MKLSLSVLLLCLLSFALYAQDGKNERERQYNRHVELGDSLYIIAEFDGAKIEYELASGLFPKRKYLKEKLENLERGREPICRADADLCKVAAEKADFLFEHGQYDEASYFYKVSLESCPVLIGPKERLIEIQEIKEKLTPTKTNAN
ncbi:MAG: hypothetical protein GC178_16365 [Flavobacteriales bacterium]|nr:hypothetical protein [Flavobacteriales bacterium]